VSESTNTEDRAHRAAHQTTAGSAGHADRHDGHDKHQGHTPEMFRDRLLVSIVLTAPILYFSTQIQAWFGFEAVSFAGDQWVNPVLATALFLYAGIVFLRGGYAEVRHGVPGMMTLISVAISVAYGYSVAVSLGLSGDPFYWELATLLDVMLLGHWIEMRSVRSASRALEHLAEMVPSMANLIGADGSVSQVPLDGLGEGDQVLVRPGEQVPIDGVIAEGASSLNEAFLTGESRPVAKTAGDEVVAGSVNGEGALTVVVTRLGDATTLSQIMRLVRDAQASRSRFQALADRAAFWLTVIALGVAAPTLVGWLAFGSGGATFAVARAVTVLVIACPHALGLAIPLVNLNATSLSARNGILVRNREAFERGRAIGIVAFDKTGTLTEGRFVVSTVTADGLSEEDALGLAAAIERGSEHPLAAAIVEAAQARNLAIDPAKRVTAIPGQGLEGDVGSRTIRVGRPEWAADLGAVPPPTLSVAVDAADERGETAVVVVTEGRVAAVISLADKVRPGARIAIERLEALGVTPVMITGDAEAVAATVAKEIGIARYFARVLPEDKARLVARLGSEAPIAFVGDGINDAPALLAADLGIAIGAGTNVAIESADLVLVDNDPADVAAALTLARATSRKMRQNLAWATGYNVFAIPLAAGATAGVGLVLDPAVGALLMSLSTVIVAINAMMLRRIDLSPTAP